MLTRLGRESRRSRFGRDRRGVAAMEFALVAPVLIVLIGCVPDIGNAIAAANRAGKLAETMAQLVSQSKVPLTTTDLDQVLNASPLVDPAMLDYARAAKVPIENSATVIISSVAFTQKDPKCTANCQYDANVVFSRALSGSARSCGTLSPGTDGGLGSLPPSVYGAPSLVVVDVTTRFKPVVAGMLLKELSFKRTAYFRPRYLARVDSTVNCQAYAQ